MCWKEVLKIKIWRSIGSNWDQYLKPRLGKLWQFWGPKNVVWSSPWLKTYSKQKYIFFWQYRSSQSSGEPWLCEDVLFKETVGYIAYAYEMWMACVLSKIRLKKLKFLSFIHTDHYHHSLIQNKADSLTVPKNYNLHILHLICNRQNIQSLKRGDGKSIRNFI